MSKISNSRKEKGNHNIINSFQMSNEILIECLYFVCFAEYFDTEVITVVICTFLYNNFLSLKWDGILRLIKPTDLNINENVIIQFNILEDFINFSRL